MTNEERIEEIIFETHKLGLKEYLFGLIKDLSKNNKTKDRIELYEMAFKMIKIDENKNK